MSYIVAPISTLVKTIILIVLPHTISYIVNEINMPQHLTLNHLFSKCGGLKYTAYFFNILSTSSTW